MARRSKSLEDYRALATEHELEFCGDAAPRYISDSVYWRCLRCQRLMRRSYSNVRKNRYNCNCRWQTLRPSDYTELASQVGIEWVGPFPINSHQNTQWRSRAGETFEASYLSLYRNIPVRLKEIIGGSSTAQGA